jgi:transposase-like protein
MENKNIPKCPNCNEMFLYESVKNLKNEPVFKFYLEACYNFLMTDYETRVVNEILFKQQLETLRRERIKFIEEQVPKAIKKIIDIALSSKLRKINKQKQVEMADRIINGSNRLCMLLTCDGKLEFTSETEQIYKCIQCDTQFCVKCEKLIKPGHVCKKDDLETMEMMEKFTYCPSCGIPVERSGGCLSITCSNCKTLFDYNTGERGGHGSTNPDLCVKESYFLSHELHENYDTQIIELIQKIESTKPTVNSHSDSVLKYLIKIPEDKESVNRTEYLLKIVKIIEKYNLSKQSYKKYNNIMSTIEKLHIDKELTHQKLIEILG